MPELPDIAAYISALEARILGQTLETSRVASAFLLRTIDPSLASVEGRSVRELQHVGKRIAIGFDNDIWLVLHLMIAGRLHWKPRGVKLSGRNQLAAFDFANGSLLLTEAGSKRRASLHVVRGESGLRALDPGGIDVFSIDMEQVMAQKCDLCGKGPQFGNNISHAHNTTRRRWNVNLQPVKAQVNGKQAHARLHQLHQDRQSRQRLSATKLRQKGSPSRFVAGWGFSCCLKILRASRRPFYCFSKPSEALLMQYRSPVGVGPSGNTWPR
jgi:ribosomal protein L28